MEHLRVDVYFSSVGLNSIVSRWVSPRSRCIPNSSSLFIFLCLFSVEVSARRSDVDRLIHSHRHRYSEPSRRAEKRADRRKKRISLQVESRREGKLLSLVVLLVVLSLRRVEVKSEKICLSFDKILSETWSCRNILRRRNLRPRADFLSPIPVDRRKRAIAHEWISPIRPTDELLLSFDRPVGFFRSTSKENRNLER